MQDDLSLFVLFVVFVYTNLSYMASKLFFSPSEDEILVQEVQANSILCDLADANYNKNMITKDSIWKAISLEIMIASVGVLRICHLHYFTCLRVCAQTHLACINLGGGD